MKIKKFMSLILSISMTMTPLTGAMSVSALSADKDNFDVNAYYSSGICGESANWVINSDGVLIVSGKGEISASYEYYNGINKFNRWGWENSAIDVNEIILEDGISVIDKENVNDNTGAFSCRYYPNVSKIILPPSLTELNGCLESYNPNKYNNLEDIYVYSRNVSDASSIYDDKAVAHWAGSGIIWHVYKGSVTESSLKDGLHLTDEDIEYILGDEQMPTVENKTPAVLEPLKDTSGPAGLLSKWEWDDLSKTLTFSGKGLISIGDDYKKYDKETEHIEIEEGITGIDAYTGGVQLTGKVISRAFYGFTALEEVKLPETLKEIGECSFYETPLTKIDLPSSLEKIGLWAFKNSNIEEVSFTNSLKEIGESAFSGTKIKSINLHEGMTIGGGAFGSCESLKEVTIPKNVTFGRATVGGNGLSRNPVTFANCTGLEKIVIEDGGEVAGNFGNVSSQNGIVEGFCQNCKNLKTVVIKGNVDYIPVGAFSGSGSSSGGCPYLTDIYLYNTGLTTITAKDYHDKNNVYYNSFDTRNNPTFHIIKGSTTEQTLKDADYLTTENTKYLASEFTAIEEKITEAEKDIESGKYTDESVDILKEALDSGKELLENAKSGYPNIVHQEDIDKAVTDIENAIRGLKVDPSVPGTTRNPDDVKKDKEAAEKIVKQAKITKLKVKSKAKKRITVSWKKVRKAKGYQVQVSKKKNFKKKLINKFTTKNKITIKRKIKSGKIYFVRVRAYATYVNTNGNIKKVYSKWNKKLRKVEVR